MEVFGNGWAEKCIPLVNFPDRRADIFSGGLLDQIRWGEAPDEPNGVATSRLIRLALAPPACLKRYHGLD
jgi:hypothetical protein